MGERLKPTADSTELIEFNKALLRKYLTKDRSALAKAEGVFHKIFEEYHEIHHNDKFHGTETLLYHQYLVLHSFDALMDVISRDFKANDAFVNNMERLLQVLSEKTELGRTELKDLLKQVPPKCTKNLQTLIFLTALFHDIGKLYNTEKWEKEFEDETLKLRKFSRHDIYGRNLFKILLIKKKSINEILDNTLQFVKSQRAKMGGELEGLKPQLKEASDSIAELEGQQIPKVLSTKVKQLQNKMDKLGRDLNLLEIDIHYLSYCRDRINELKELVDELKLGIHDLRFISKLVEHHQTLLGDSSMKYSVFVNSAEVFNAEDVKRQKQAYNDLLKFANWGKKMLGKVGLNKRTAKNDFVFYGLMIVNMADLAGSGFSDHTYAYAFKTFKKGDKFEGHHGDISEGVEFAGYLAYVYNNYSRSDDEIVKGWWGVEQSKPKGPQYDMPAIAKGLKELYDEGQLVLPAGMKQPQQLMGLLRQENPAASLKRAGLDGKMIGLVMVLMKKNQK